MTPEMHRIKLFDQIWTLFIGYEVPGHFWREDGELGQNLQKWPLCTYKVENQENQLIMLKNGP